MAIPELHQAWFTEVCKLAGIKEDGLEEAVAHGGFMMKHEQPVTFTQGMFSDDNDLLVQGMILQLPAEKAKKIAVLRKAMSHQWKSAGPRAPTIGIAPGTDVLILSLNVTPAETPPEIMIELLKLLGVTCIHLRDELSGEASEEQEMPKIDPSAITAQGLQDQLLGRLGA